MSGIKRYDEGGYGLSNMEEAADGSWVDYDSHLMVVMGQEQILNDKISELQKNLGAVVAENQMARQRHHFIRALGISIIEHSGGRMDWRGAMQDATELVEAINAVYADTPTTEAILNAVRAEGINYLASEAGEMAQLFKQGSSDWKRWKSIVFFAVTLEQQLRADAAKGGGDDH